MRGAVLVVVLLAACTHRSYVQCDDGRICPEGTTCEYERKVCLSPEELSACSVNMGTADGEHCIADGRPGICTAFDHFCLPGCGDGITDSDRGEECDDGNFASHDGCSSGCLDEIPQWIRVPDPWTGSVGHSLATATGFERIELVGGATESGLRTDQWQKDGSGSGATNGWRLMTPKPPTRSFAAMAWDATRQRLVLFGGYDQTQVLGETWEFTFLNGAVWTKTSPAMSPSARYGASMVFDPVAQKIVLFGGTTGSVVLADTWQYDGTTWTQLFPTTPPPARYHASMAWDAFRNHAVLFGGNDGTFDSNDLDKSLLGDTWEYAAGVWTAKPSATGPSKRFGAAMAYYRENTNPVRVARVILFGGLTTGQQTVSDTWQYTDTGWTQIATNPTPPNRFAAAAAYTETGDMVVLVGGASSRTSQPLADVWELHFDTWVEKTPHAEPPARYDAPAAYDQATREFQIVGGFDGTSVRTDGWLHIDSGWYTMADNDGHPTTSGHAMAYDPMRQKMVVFGGVSPSMADVNTTTEFQVVNNQRVWSQPSLGQSPPGRSRAAFGFDGSELVLFGGIRNGAPMIDTWEYNGNAWTETTSPSVPSGTAPAGAYDPIGKRFVVFDEGGQTMVYANHAWSLPALFGNPPPARSNAMMTFDTQRKRLVLIGGNSGSTYFADVWELELRPDGAAEWKELHVPAGGPLPRLNAGWASDLYLRKTFLFGGRGPARTFGDTWIFEFRSATPDEDCGGDHDVDGDLHTNPTDPDCCGHHEPPDCDRL